MLQNKDLQYGMLCCLDADHAAFRYQTQFAAHMSSNIYLSAQSLLLFPEAVIQGDDCMMTSIYHSLGKGGHMTNKK